MAVINLTDARIKKELSKTLWDMRNFIAEETAAGRPVIVVVDSEHDAVPWCTCNHTGKCLGCNIERIVKEGLGTDGLAYLLERVKEGETNGRK